MVARRCDRGDVDPPSAPVTVTTALAQDQAASTTGQTVVVPAGGTRAAALLDGAAIRAHAPER